MGTDASWLAWQSQAVSWSDPWFGLWAELPSDGGDVDGGRWLCGKLELMRTTGAHA